MKTEKTKVNKFFTVMGYIFVAMLALSAVSFATDNEPERTTNDTQWAEFEEGYMESCAISETFRGYCQCTLDTMEANAGRDRVYELSYEYIETKETPKEMDVAVNKCLYLLK